jgi:hypothetical protein
MVGKYFYGYIRSNSDRCGRHSMMQTDLLPDLILNITCLYPRLGIHKSSLARGSSFSYQLWVGWSSFKLSLYKKLLIIKFIRKNYSRCLTTKSVEGSSLALECVDDIERSNSLSLGVFSVGDCITDNVLEESLEHSTSLLDSLKTPTWLLFMPSVSLSSPRISSLLPVYVESDLNLFLIKRFVATMKVFY